MIDTATFTEMALSYPGTTRQPHFDKTAFHAKKKIFATLDAAKNQVNIKLSLIDQDVFCAFDRASMFPVPNKWGKQGWTTINLNSVRKDILEDALAIAYQQVTSKK